MLECILILMQCFNIVLIIVLYIYMYTYIYTYIIYTYVLQNSVNLSLLNVWAS